MTHDIDDIPLDLREDSVTWLTEAMHRYLVGDTPSQHTAYVTAQSTLFYTILHHTPLLDKSTQTPADLKEIQTK